jgi:hypothetical protein
MPYHVEIKHSIRRAWAFNLSEERVSADVAGPWLAGQMIELGDREWEPRESSLRIIEGPELAPPDLAYGQGWNAAQQSGEDVTRRLLADAPPPTQVVVLAEARGARVLLEASQEPSAELLHEAAEALRSMAADG